MSEWRQQRDRWLLSEAIETGLNPGGSSLLLSGLPEGSSSLG